MNDAPDTFLFGARDVLLAAHGAMSTILLAASTGHVVEAVRRAKGRIARAGIERRFARAVTLAFPITFALGATLYPTYRVHARAAWLDQHAFGIAELFDVKENYASLALVLALGLWPVSALLRDDDELALFRVHAISSAIVCSVVWFDAVAGLIVWSTRGLG